MTESPMQLSCLAPGAYFITRCMSQNRVAISRALSTISASLTQGLGSFLGDFVVSLEQVLLQRFKLDIRWQSQRMQRILGMFFLVQGKIFSRGILLSNPNHLDLCCLVLGTRGQEVPESDVPVRPTRNCFGNNCSPNM